MEMDTSAAPLRVGCTASTRFPCSTTCGTAGCGSRVRKKAASPCSAPTSATSRPSRRVVAETQPEVLIHLAAIHYIPECERHPDEAIAVNTLGTSNLLRACAGHPLCVRLDRRSLRRLRHAARGVLEPRRARGHLRPDQAPRGELRPVPAQRTGWTRGSCACST